MEDIFFFFHIAGVVVSFISTLYADHAGFNWFRGKVERVEESKIRKAHRFVWTGLILTIVSGVLVFWDKRGYLLNDSPAFLGKMAFVLALTINGFFIGRFLGVSTQKAFKDLTTKEKIPLFISGAVSSISWAGAFVLAFFL